MLENLKVFATKLADYVLLAGLVTMGILAAVESWRKSPLLPLAALCLGPAAGMVAAQVAGETAGIVATFVGTLMGPGMVAQTQDPDVIRRILRHYIDKNFPSKDETPKNEGEE